MKSGLHGIKPWNHKHCEILHLLDKPLLSLVPLTGFSSINNPSIACWPLPLAVPLISPLAMVPCVLIICVSFFPPKNTMVFTVLLPTPFPVTKFYTCPLFPHISFTLSHSPGNGNFTLKIYQQLLNPNKLKFLPQYTSLNILFPDVFLPDLSSSFCSFLVFNESPLSLLFQLLLSLFMDFKASFIHGQEDPYIISAALIFFSPWDQYYQWHGRWNHPNAMEISQTFPKPNTILSHFPQYLSPSLLLSLYEMHIRSSNIKITKLNI